jgi:MFS transporter, SP family, inositol transporter
MDPRRTAAGTAGRSGTDDSTTSEGQDMTAAPSVTRNPWWLTVVAGMASYLDSAAIVTSGIAIVMLKDFLGLDSGQIGVLSAILTASIALGAGTGGRLGDRFGRRRVFLVTMVVVAVAATTLCLAPSYPVYLVGIVLIGVGTGADLPVSLASVAEAAADGQRGRMVSFTHILWKLGIIVSQLLGALVGDSGRAGAQIMYGHIAVVAALTLIARLPVPESARWERARREAAARPADAAAPGALRALLRPPYLAAFLGLIVFYSLINLGMNTNGQFGALIFTETAGASVSLYSRVGLVTTVVGFVLVFALMKVVDGRHRIAWFVFGSVCAVTGSLLPVVFGPTTVTLTAMLVLWALCSVFAGEPMMKLWTQESFPTLLRSTAQGSIIFVARVSAALLALVTPLILQAGPRVLFASIAAMALVATTTALVVFRGRTSTEFDREDQALADDDGPRSDGCCTDDADGTGAGPVTEGTEVGSAR